MQGSSARRIAAAIAITTITPLGAGSSGCGSEPGRSDSPDGSRTGTPGAGSSLADPAGSSADRANGPDDPGTGEHLTVAIRPGAHVAVREAPGGARSSRIGPRTEFGSPTVLSVARQRGRWLGVETEMAANSRLGWLRFDRSAMRRGSTPWSLRADLSDRMLELRRGERVVDRIRVSVGGPRTPTPTGRFAVTDRVDEGISPAYGAGALALTAEQPSLPPDWPGGDRIAIHGGEGATGRAVSNGCLRARDGDIIRLSHQVPLGAPVRIER